MSATIDTVSIYRQYTQIKAKYPTTVLLFRVGDFYEAWNDDAATLATITETSIHSRKSTDTLGNPIEMPMAAVPYFAAEPYIGKLIAAGHKVAICEKIGNPS